MTATTRDLVARLAELLHREHDAMAEFLVALAEFDRAKGWRELGYAGLFPFLERELGLSKSAAFFRMKAAQLIQAFPEIVEPLRDGRLCLSTIAEVAKVLTPENREAVVPRFFHRSKQEAMEISAELAPVQDPPKRTVVTVVRRELPGSEHPGLVLRETSSQTVLPEELALAPSARSEALARMVAPRDEIVPLTGDLRRMHITVSRNFREKVEAAKMALSHSAPGASLEQVLEAGLDLILEKDAKKKALVAEPRPAKDPNLLRFDTRYIPAEIRREVWKRDQGMCQWPLEGGGICGSTFQLEVDHIDGFQPGKPITAKDLRVCCDPHNDLHARQVYGDEYMKQFRRRGQRRSWDARLAPLRIPNETTTEDAHPGAGSKSAHQSS
jgi:hypothetical protein